MMFNSGKIANGPGNSRRRARALGASGKKYLVGAVLLLSLALAKRAEADITYYANDTVGNGTVTGTITTNGTLGTLNVSDFVDWNLTVADNSGTASLLGPLSGDNSGIDISSNNVTATATLLQFDFNGNGGFMDIYSLATCSPPEWSFETVGSGEACNGTQGNQEGISANDPFPSGTYSAESGEVTFATAAAAVPEPSSLALLILVIPAIYVRSRHAKWMQSPKGRVVNCG